MSYIVAVDCLKGVGCYSLASGFGMEQRKGFDQAFTLQLIFSGPWHCAWLFP
jgi:hypothetical protein